MPTRKCFFCQIAKPMEEYQFSCEKCMTRELDILIGVFWFIHCYGSDYCPVRLIYSDMDTVGAFKVTPEMMNSWLNRGYLEINEISSIRVPPPVTNYLQQNGYNQSPEFDQTLSHVEQKHNEKKRMDAARHSNNQPGQAAAKRFRMVFQEKQ